MRQLREQYESTKRDLEGYTKLGKPEELQSHVSVATAIAKEATTIGSELGYDEADVRDSLTNDPVGTLIFLRNKKAEADAQAGAQPTTQADLDKLLDQKLDKRLKPINEREEKRLNDEANFRFEQSFDIEVKKLFKDVELPPEEKDILHTVAQEMMSYDKKAVSSLKFAGDVSNVAKYVAEARAFLDKYYLVRAQRERGAVLPGPGEQTPAGEPKKKFSLDDIIQNPGVMGPKYA